MQAESDAGCTIIKVNMSDAFASSTMLKAYPSTKASELCAVIAHKLALTPAEIPLHHLILVFTVIGWTGRRHHTIKTLTADENVLNVLDEVMKKQNTKHNNLEGKLNTYSTWHYKDSLSHPLDADFDPDDDASGNSTSEEEEDISLSDVSYLRQNDRKGFMLKKSKKDPNLWRRRYCILTDKLWCIDAKRSIPRATSIDIFNNITLANNHTVEIPYCFALVRKQRRGGSSGSSSSGSSHTSATGSVQQGKLTDYYFRVQSEVSMASWMSELRQRIALNRENQVMVLAEQIICDEEKSRYKKIAKAVAPFTADYSIYCDPSYSGGKIVDSVSPRSLTSTPSTVDSFAPTQLQHGVPVGVLAQSFRNSPAPQDSTASNSRLGRTMSDSSAAVVIAPTPAPAPVRASVVPVPTLQVRTATLARSDKHMGHDNGDAGYSGVCVFGSSRFTNNVASRLHRFHKHNTIEADILSFVLAVGRFKEICRHDLQYSVQQQWERVCVIYNEFIVYQLLFNANELLPASVFSSGDSSPVRPPREKSPENLGGGGGGGGNCCQTVSVATGGGLNSMIWQLGNRNGEGASQNVLIACLRTILSNFKAVDPAIGGNSSGSGKHPGPSHQSQSLSQPHGVVSKTYRYRREDINAVIPPPVNPYSAVTSSSGASTGGSGSAVAAGGTSSTTATTSSSSSYWLWPSSTTTTTTTTATAAAAPSSPSPVKKKTAPPLPARTTTTDAAPRLPVSAADTLDLKKIPEYLSITGSNATSTRNGKPTHSLLDDSRSPPSSLFDTIIEELTLNKLVNVSSLK